NAAVLLDYPGELERLLDVTQDIEQRLGRVREVRWGPRTLDLDLLLAGSRVLTTERLTVPHALLHERAFALLPLLELQPDAVDPRTGASYAARVAAFHSQRIERLEGPEWAK
ncbi:MAG TPA: 2-amino-4-hydroxy-6-hydroxymethyldihydropteridine diphosphokinase, partial [Polyangiaceae bacterium]|nr:2-amino-4-hydroxy-6-hydroxymethyldihydropteridine diphosphokinase [Polyangiaceae bacterium]